MRITEDIVTKALTAPMTDTLNQIAVIKASEDPEYVSSWLLVFVGLS